MRRLLDDDLEAVLTGARGPTVTRHLDACHACRGVRADQETWWNRLRSAIPNPPGPREDFVQNTMQKLRAMFG